MVSIMDVSVYGTALIVGVFFIGYYKGKVDAWGSAYELGEKSGWNQAMRRQL